MQIELSREKFKVTVFSAMPFGQMLNHLWLELVLYTAECSEVLRSLLYLHLGEVTGAREGERKDIHVVEY